MDDLLRLLTLQDTTTRVVMAGTVVLAIAAAVVGSLSVLRRRALVGDAVAHASLPGVCLAWFVTGDRSFAALLLGALVLGAASMAMIAFVKRVSRVREDATIAIAIGGFFGLGIVLSRLIQNLPSGNRAGLDGFIYGKAASMISSDAWLVLGVATIALTIVLLLRKEFALLCFDREYAAGQGWPVHGLDALLLVLVAVVTVAGLPSVGVVLVVALLVVPAAAARFWTDSFNAMLWIAAFVGAISAFVGTALSAVVPAPAGASGGGWPTGPLIVLSAGACFIVSLLCAPQRGVFADALRARRVRQRMAVHHLLRRAWEQLEDGALDRPFQPSPRGGGARSRAVSLAMRRCFVKRTGTTLTLTTAGQIEAARITRTHRLWEHFLIEHAEIAPDHVDRDADEIEHSLPAELIARLDDGVRVRRGRVVSDGLVSVLVPPSPHPIAPTGGAA